MSFIPQLKGVNEDKFVGNGLRFASKAEALAWAEHRQSIWYGCKAGAQNRRAFKSSDPVNYRYVDGKLIAVEPECPPKDI
jgi:hypothetical protein